MTCQVTKVGRTLLFTKTNFKDFIFTDIIIHAKASSVQVMSVIIMSDNVVIFKLSYNPGYVPKNRRTDITNHRPISLSYGHFNVNKISKKQIVKNISVP